MKSHVPGLHSTPSPSESPSQRPGHTFAAAGCPVPGRSHADERGAILGRATGQPAASLDLAPSSADPGKILIEHDAEEAGGSWPVEYTTDDEGRIEDPVGLTLDEITGEADARGAKALVSAGLTVVLLALALAVVLATRGT